VLEKLIAEAPKTNQRRTVDYDKVVAYIQKLKRGFTVAEVAKATGIKYNYIRGYLERRLVNVDEVEEHLSETDKFVKVNGVYVSIALLAKKS
jgi:ribosomal protein L13E